MTEHSSSDKQLDEYLSGQSALSELYRQLDAGVPSTDTDGRILQAATERRHRASWVIPAALAASLLTGIVLLWWAHYPPSGTGTGESPNLAAPEQDSRLPDQIDRSLHNNPVADAWLNRILKLQQAGKTGQAEIEFRKFRQAYPLYSIDAKRFGSLKQYDQ